MKWIWLAASGICLTGCIASDGLRTLAMADNNRDNFVRISAGMSEIAVVRIMGKPYDYETVEIESDIYDIWYYVTMPTGFGQTRMVKRNLTPVVFKNGVLIGWGYEPYSYVIRDEKRQAQKTADAEKAAEEKPAPELENKTLEKALKPATTSLSQTNALPGRDPESDEAIPSERHPKNTNTPPNSKNPKKSDKPPNPQLIPTQQAPKEPKPPKQPKPQKQPKPEHQKAPKPPNRRPEERTHPVQPPPPQQPPPPKQKGVSMSKCTKETEVPEASRSEEEEERGTDGEEQKPPLNSKDRRMLQDESEQDFDYW